MERNSHEGFSNEEGMKAEDDNPKQYERIQPHAPTPYGEMPPGYEKPDDGKPKPELDYDTTSSESGRGAMIIGRDGEVETDDDDDIFKKW